MRSVGVNGTSLCVDGIGADADPPILLVGGASMPLDWWDDALCARLAAGGRRIIRYDLRDTGQSAHEPAGAPGYDADDVVADVPAPLDALGLGRAHIAGISMGGRIAQRLAIEQPARVATLTLLSTTSDGPGSEDLPSPAPQLAARFRHPPPEPDWTDRDATLDHIVDEPLRPRLDQITAPPLVVHGSDDPLFPPAHGEALAREIPGARFLLLPGVGHEVPPPRGRDVFVPALLEHTASAG